MNLHRTWRDILADASARLAAAGVDGARRDARVLLADTLGVDLAGLIAVETDAPKGDGDGARLDDFESRIRRRLAGEPVSLIRGWREFYGRRFIVTADVLDPRPETELLVEQGLAHLPPGGRVLDLGTGSGCILLSILAERPDATGVGVDLSPAALAIAARNAEALGLTNRATLKRGSWDAEAAESPAFDLVVSNPPYIPAADIAGLDREVRNHDPRLALDGGPDGLAPYRIIPGLAPRLLKPDGWLAFEVGAGQADDVMALMAAVGFSCLTRVNDLAGHARIVVGKHGSKA